MRIKFPFFIFLTLSFSTGCNPGNGKTSVSFYDSVGNVYSTSNASEIIKEEYNLKQNITLLLIATSSEANEEYQKQLEIIENLNAEKMNFLYIVSRVSDADHSGYFTDRKTASELLAGKPYRIQIIKNGGVVLNDSHKVLPAETLLDLLETK